MAGLFSWLSWATSMALLLVGLLALAFALYVLATCLYNHIVAEYISNPWRHIPRPKSDASWLSRLFAGDFGYIKAEQPGEAHAQWISELGGVYRYQHALGKPRIFLSDPKALMYIMGPSRSYKYPKPLHTQTFLATVLGRGLVAIEGDVHRRQRRIISPAFTNAAVRELQGIMDMHARRMAVKIGEQVDRAVDRRRANPGAKNVELLVGEAFPDSQICLSSYPEPSAVIDTIFWTSRTALDVIGEAGFGYKFNSLERGNEDELSEAITELLSCVMDVDLVQALTVILSEKPGLGWLAQIPTRRNLAIQKAKDVVSRVCTDILAKVKAEVTAEASLHVASRPPSPLVTNFAESGAVPRDAGRHVAQSLPKSGSVTPPDSDGAPNMMRRQSSGLSLRNLVRRRSSAAALSSSDEEEHGTLVGSVPPSPRLKLSLPAPNAPKSLMVPPTPGLLTPKSLTKEAFDEAQGDKKAGSLLHRVLRANLAADVKPSERMSDEELINVPTTFILAGAETSGTQVSWTLQLLAENQAAQDKLRAQILAAEEEHAGSLNDANLEHSVAGDVNRLPYLDMCLKESLRLMSAIPSTVRVATEDDVVPLSKPYPRADGRGTYDSVVIPAGHELFLPISAVNLSPDLWGADAHLYVPERWSDKPPEAVRNLPGGLQTFLAGPRNCIGQRFASTEVKVMLTHLLRRFRFHVVPGFELVQRQMIARRAFVKGQEKYGTRMPLIVTRLDESTMKSSAAPSSEETTNRPLASIAEATLGTPAYAPAAAAAAA